MAKKKPKQPDSGANQVARLKEMRLKELDAHYTQHLKRLRNILDKFRKKRNAPTDKTSEPPV